MGGAFEGLFREFGREAFQLQVREVPAGHGAAAFQRFLTGEGDDLGWRQGWLELVRDAVAAGRSIRRVRVVSVPHGDYTRWGLTVAARDVAAGEEVLWLPRHFADSAMSTDDFWLFDDERVVFEVFQDGRFVGGAATTDPAIVERCRSLRDRVWRRAIPHQEYEVSDFVRA